MIIIILYSLLSIHETTQTAQPGVDLDRFFLVMTVIVVNREGVLLTQPLTYKNVYIHHRCMFALALDAPKKTLGNVRNTLQ